MGKRTSLYLSDELEAAVKASGLPLAELIRRGLHAPPAAPEAIPAECFEDVAALAQKEFIRAVAAENAPPPAPAWSPKSRPPIAGQCPPHPKGRIHKGLCGACGTHVGTAGGDHG